LRGHDIVVPVEVQGALPSAVKSEDVETGAIVFGRCLDHAVVEPEAVQFQPKAVRAFAIVISRWVLTRDPNQVLAKSQNGISVDIKDSY
jgi:hypothetical protein